MQRGGGSKARAENNNGPVAGGLLQLVERSERRRSQPREPRGACAAAEAGIIHSPNFDRPVIPHFRFGGDPAISAIGIAVETQDVDFGLAALLSQGGTRRPNFEVASLKRNGLPIRGARVDAVGRR